MPTYDYGCSKCKATFEKMLKMSEREVPLTQPCPECQSEGTIEQAFVGATAIGDPIRLGVKRPDSGWGDVLSKVKSAHPKGHWSDKKYVPHGGR